MSARPATWRAPAPRWRRSAPPGFTRPCEPVLVDRPAAGPGWLHEVKHHGFRIVALKQGALVKVWSRRAAGFTERFSRIAETVRGLPADEALIDGEAVVFRHDGRSDFHAVLTKRGARMAVRRFGRGPYLKL
jgi:bifunctional non-homologous end joining protein LigD